MNALVPQNFGVLSTKFAGQAIENDLGAGISGGYGSIGYKGKVWSTRYKGTENALMRDDGDGPRGSIEVVILKASTLISKVWYEKGFEDDGAKQKPDCFSTNGVTPDPTSAKKQCTVCKLCPRDAFGSAVKQDGTPGKGKSCSDSKRLAVVPLMDINNDMLGGPMLLRVPAGSLNDVATYGTGVQKLGFPYYGVGTRIAFDAKEAFPKFVFSPIRPLTDPEAEAVLALRADPRVDRILAEDIHETAALEAPKPDAMAFEQPAGSAQPSLQQAAVAQAQAEATKVTPSPRKARAAAAPAPTPAPAPAPAPAQAAGGFGASAPAPSAAAPSVVAADNAASAADFDAALDAELEALMGQPA